MKTNTLETSAEVLQKKGYELISLVFSKYELSLLKNPIDEYCCPVIQLQKDEDKHIFDSLISFAAMMRVNDDLSQYSDKHLEENPEGVGSITTKENKEPLSLREACNKIIHAKSVEFKLEYQEEHPLYPNYDGGLYSKEEWQKYKNPTITLHGDFNGSSWTAEIELINFVCCYPWAAEVPF